MYGSSNPQPSGTPGQTVESTNNQYYYSSTEAKLTQNDGKTDNLGAENLKSSFNKERPDSYNSSVDQITVENPSGARTKIYSDTKLIPVQAQANSQEGPIKATYQGDMPKSKIKNLYRAYGKIDPIKIRKGIHKIRRQRPKSTN